MSEVTEAPRGISGGVVVGTDGSEGGRAALRFAAGEALVRSCPLHVVRAWTLANAPRPASAGFGEVPSLGEYEVAVRAELIREIEEVLAGVPGAGQLQVVEHAVHGPAARVLVAASAEADLLVVGARGRGGFVGLLLGGISDQVVRFSMCPVVIVPSRAARQAVAAGQAAG
jgi:nucleotide-binding universal stress UspA family protein